MKLYIIRSISQDRKASINGTWCSMTIRSFRWHPLVTGANDSSCTAIGTYAFCPVGLISLSTSWNNLCRSRVNLSCAITLVVLQVELFSKHISAFREDTGIYWGTNWSAIINYVTSVRDLRLLVPESRSSILIS